MELHILNGDALIDRMQEAGFTNQIVCRECLIDGPVKASSIEEFFNQRAQFLDNDKEDRPPYDEYVKEEFQQLSSLPHNAVVNVWFGDDLFCQANMWFTIDYLQQVQPGAAIYRVFSNVSEENRWQDFAGLDSNDFINCYKERVLFTAADLQLARNLWKAYVEDDFNTLHALSNSSSPCFRYLDEVVEAHIDRFPQQGLNRPERTLQEIKQSGVTNFAQIFPSFSQREGIYGFGDTQVLAMLNKIP